MDRACRSAISSKIVDKVLQYWVYHSLRTVPEEPDERSNAAKSGTTIEREADTRCFDNHIQTYYNATKEQWVMCYRKKAGINTNVHVERFYCLLEYIYMKEKVTSKFMCLHLLLKLLFTSL